MRIGSVLKHASQAVLEGALIAALIVGLVAGTAFAARGGGGGGGGGGGHKPGGGSTGNASLAVAPNPVPAYSSFKATGCGYKPNAGLQFNLYSTGVAAVYGGTADGSGCLSNVVLWANAPGSARLDVLEGSVTKVASTSFTIQ
jgi:hypothetical protein